MDKEHGQDGHRMSIPEAAGLLGVSSKTIRRYIDKGAIAKIADGNRVFLSSFDVHSLLLKSKPDVDKQCGQADKNDGHGHPTEHISVDTVDNGRGQYPVVVDTVFPWMLAKLLDQEREIGRLEGELRALREIRTPWWRRMFSRRS